MMGWLREFSGSYVVGLTAVAVILIAIAATAASMSLKLVGSKE
jgi:MFS transporter, ACS family, tartrate transporter